MKKPLPERAMTYKKFVKQFQILQKNNSKIQILKLLKDQKILKNQMIHYLEIIEIKQNICCRVTNCSPNPKEVGYRPNKPSTINL